MIFEAASERRTEFRICSRDTPRTSNGAADDPWRTHVTGRVRVGIEAIATGHRIIWNREEVWKRCSEEIDARSYYDSLIALGLDFGDRFRGIVYIRRCMAKPWLKFDCRKSWRTTQGLTESIPPFWTLVFTCLVRRCPQTAIKTLIF